MLTYILTIVITRLYGWASEVVTWAVRLRDVPLLGTWLYSGLADVAYYLSVIAGYLLDAKGYLTDLESRTAEALRRVDLSVAIWSLWADWQAIRTDTLGWLRAKIERLVRDGDALIMYPAYWVYLRVREQWPLAGFILGDFTGWMRSWAWAHFYALYVLWTSPRDFLLGLLGRVSSDAVRLVTYPQAWIQDALVSALHLPPGMWADPVGVMWEWMLDGLEGRMGSLWRRMYVLAERLLFKMWDGV